MTNKFFKAVHKQTGETIEFGLEDIHIDKCCDGIPTLWFHGDERYTGLFETEMLNWLKDYDLFYFHQGEYYVYGK